MENQIIKRGRGRPKEGLAIHEKYICPDCGRTISKVSRPLHKKSQIHLLHKQMKETVEGNLNKIVIRMLTIDQTLLNKTTQNNIS